MAVVFLLVFGWWFCSVAMVGGLLLWCWKGTSEGFGQVMWWIRRL